jgi:hypothetical protein
LSIFLLRCEPNLSRLAVPHKKHHVDHENDFGLAPRRCNVDTFSVSPSFFPAVAMVSLHDDVLAFSEQNIRLPLPAASAKRKKSSEKCHVASGAGKMNF